MNDVNQDDSIKQVNLYKKIFIILIINIFFKYYTQQKALIYKSKAWQYKNTNQ